MKIEQKAIEEIQNQFKCIGIDYTKNRDVTAIAVAHGERAEAVIKALEKQIPKEPEFIDRDAGCFECSVCGMLVYCSDEPESHKYCLGCGQALKWD